MKSKLLISIYILLAGVLVYFAYPIIKSRYFDQDESRKDVSGEIPQGGSDEGAISQEDEAVNPKEEDNNLNGEEAMIPEEKSFLEITTKDCGNKCADFAGNAEKLKYCRQSCGLFPVEKKADGCESRAGLEKDYCLKDLAVSKTDFKICDEIQDSGIKKTCKNRVTEDILNGEKSL